MNSKHIHMFIREENSDCSQWIPFTDVSINPSQKILTLKVISLLLAFVFCAPGWLSTADNGLHLWKIKRTDKAVNLGVSELKQALKTK